MLSPPENVKEFTGKVVDLLLHPEYCEILSHQCREIAVKEYSLELQAQQYKALYESVIYKKLAKQT